ncbi:FAD synthetase [Alteribacillus bidgolensis]|uniref:FAD synthase n=1 Tax=Alteribacillus bidgolensis TaxID=930129 RepID=A0A1G8IDV1_9BACI|nr:FAD synthetase [Alteribacillus bidgolensis]SDI17094.1 riboflavin kinase/FMN adenylyltransferase [Alteribacillus bidgolensis]
MKVHTPHNLDICASVLTIGALDGVHRGHQALLSKAKIRAEELDVPFVVYTFDPPPKVFFRNCLLLTTLEEKLERLENMGADHVIVGSFNELFAKQDIPVFIKELKEICPIEIWEGPNFLFGKNRKGTIQTLSQHFNVKIQPPVICEKGEVISSSRIRQLYKEKNSTQANHLLGWKNSLIEI